MSFLSPTYILNDFNQHISKPKTQLHYKPITYHVSLKNLQCHITTKTSNVSIDERISCLHCLNSNTLQ